MGYNIDGMAMERFVKVHPGNPKAGIGFTSTTTMKAYLSLGFTTADETTDSCVTHDTTKVAHYYKYDYFW